MSERLMKHSSIFSEQEESMFEDEDDGFKSDRFKKYITEDLFKIFSYVDAIIDTLPISFQKEYDNILDYREKVKFILKELYYSFFLQKVPQEIWIDFIRNGEFDNCSSLNNFIIENALQPIQEIINDSNLTSLQKERKIYYLVQSIKCENKRMDALMALFYDFEIEEWKLLVKEFKPLYNYYFQHENIVHYVKQWKSRCKERYPELYKTSEKIPYGEKWTPISNSNIILFSEGFYKSCQIFCYREKYDFIYLEYIKDKKKIPVNNVTLSAILDEKSHFEDEIFYLKNRTACKLWYEKDGEIIKDSEEVYQWHKKTYQESNWFESMLYIQWCELNEIYQQYIMQFLQKQINVLKIENLNLKKTSTVTVNEILQIVHNIEGRLNNQYPLFEYHSHFHSILPYLDESKIISLSADIIFPEYQEQTPDVQQKLNEIWKESFDYLKKKISFSMKEKKTPLFIKKPILGFHYPSSIKNSLLYILQEKSLWEIMKYQHLQNNKIIREPTMIEKEDKFLESLKVLKKERLN